MISNLVYISTVRTVCCKTQFDTTYPVPLNGIISPDEFRDSINRINRQTSSYRTLIIFIIAFTVCMITAMSAFIISGIQPSNSDSFEFSVLIIAGFGITIFGFFVFYLAYNFIEAGRTLNLPFTIMKESMKYSSRSPIPCTWRLETTRNYFGGLGNHRGSRLGNRLVIEIGSSTRPENGISYINRDANVNNHSTNNG